MKSRVSLIVALLVALGCLSAPRPGAAQDMGQVSPQGLQAILTGPLMPPALGGARFDVTIVEYFDYQCPVCRRIDPYVRTLIQGDARVRLVYKDWPVFGAMSVYAAYCTLAAAHLGQYEKAHRALMSAQGRFDSREQIEGVLRAAGLDVPAIQAFIAAHQMELSAVLTRNHGEAHALGLKGTPGVLIGDHLVMGGLTPDQLRLLVDQARGSLQASEQGRSRAQRSSAP